MHHLRLSVYRILETSSGKRRGFSLAFNIVLITIITLNAIAIVLHTVPEYNRRFTQLFYDFELFSVLFFTIEYLLRIWVCVENDRYRHWFWGRLRYLFSASSIIDILAIFPFYFTLFATDLAIVRILRLFRIFRLFRISRYSHAFRMIQRVVTDKKEELILSMTFVVFMLIIVSSIMYYVEHTAQPDKFSSIPATMWWGVSAMTTVGYGDIHPITPLGKLLGGLAAIMGIGLFALPTGILVSGFTEQIRNQKVTVIRRCPHCGKEIRDV
ncbi:ion transporter [Spirosoma utsteinense]|uniref:Voltage-gated potassium channel n=1 Tax=Spirosoma utsteinense TaxID=2585773 RepID=A0ABR6WB08_9BACT|nr:ion transporter [Spirosoma utsteinense]MBC3786830.1 voltage-gated potassium channel [Spirosoma utsteinense]MBC3793749.1 voltage-gated potassium channel [Spirosoma utsteinense]